MQSVAVYMWIAGIIYKKAMVIPTITAMSNLKITNSGMQVVYISYIYESPYLPWRYVQTDPSMPVWHFVKICNI